MTPIWITAIVNPSRIGVNKSRRFVAWFSLRISVNTTVVYTMVNKRNTEQTLATANGYRISGFSVSTNTTRDAEMASIFTRSRKDRKTGSGWISCQANWLKAG